MHLGHLEKKLGKKSGCSLGSSIGSDEIEEKTGNLNHILKWDFKIVMF